jgi:hypothetical protein
VEVVTTDPGAACCPGCGTASTSVKQNVITGPKDLSYGDRPLAVVWRTRRWRWGRADCARESFTERIPELPAGARTTGRPRRAVAVAVAAGGGRGRRQPSTELVHRAARGRRAQSHSAARGGHRHEIHARLYDFYTWCADAELTTLAQTIQTWWPAVLVFLHTRITNARTEGFNRQVKHIKRAGYGFRNRSNYRHRVRLHWTRSTRPRPA